MTVEEFKQQIEGLGFRYDEEFQCYMNFDYKFFPGSQAVLSFGIWDDAVGIWSHATYNDFADDETYQGQYFDEDIDFEQLKSIPNIQTLIENEVTKSKQRYRERCERELVIENEVDYGIHRQCLCPFVREFKILFLQYGGKKIDDNYEIYGLGNPGISGRTHIKDFPEFYEKLSIRFEYDKIILFCDGYVDTWSDERLEDFFKYYDEPNYENWGVPKCDRIYTFLCDWRFVLEDLKYNAWKEIFDSEEESFIDSYKTSEWQRKKYKILDRDDFTCQLCGEKHGIMEVHHLTYKHCNGKAYEADDSELVTLCHSCHEKDDKKDGSHQYFDNGRYYIKTGNPPVVVALTENK